MIGLLEEARHRSEYTQILASLYCFTLAVTYVAALYLLVPKKVRKLSRDHAQHIKYRVIASLIASIGAILSYPILFCAKADDSATATFSTLHVMFSTKHSLGCLIHTIILYLGPIVAGLLYVFDEREAALTRARSRGEKKPEASFPKVVFRRTILPTLLSFINPIKPEDRWTSIRNFLVAPWTEEIVFRGCMLSALLGSGMSPAKVVMISPLFFGVAHAHHAWTRLSNGERIQSVLFVTAFQFTYTSLFGAYAAYATFRTGSVFGPFLSHAYCNFMGLPDFNFIYPRHPMYPHRKILLAAFFVGVFGFKWGFSSDRLLPKPAVLPTLIHGDSL